MDRDLVIRRVTISAVIALAVILAVVIMVRIASNIFDSGASSTAPVAAVLSDYNDDASNVRLTYDGAVVGREDHRAVRITVDSKERKIEILEGYNGKVLETKTYANDAAAYGVFLRALELKGYLEAQSNGVGNDERGVCSAGKRVVVELFNNTTEISRLWATSCGTDQGTLAGNGRAIFNLFKKQISDYETLTEDIKF